MSVRVVASYTEPVYLLQLTRVSNKLYVCARRRQPHREIVRSALWRVCMRTAACRWNCAVLTAFSLSEQHARSYKSTVNRIWLNKRRTTVHKLIIVSIASFNIYVRFFGVFNDGCVWVLWMQYLSIKDVRIICAKGACYVQMLLCMNRMHAIVIINISTVCHTLMLVVNYMYKNQVQLNCTSHSL